MTATATKPFNAWGLSKGQVTKHFAAGDRVAFAVGSNRGYRRVNVYSGRVEYGTIVSTEAHEHAWDRFVQSWGIRRTSKSWQGAQVGFLLRRDDGSEVVAKAIFGTEADAKAERKIADEAHRRNEIAATARKERNLRNAKIILGALATRGVDKGLTDYDAAAGKAPALTIAELAELLGVEIEEA